MGNYIGPLPTECNMCKMSFERRPPKTFVDGKTQYGPWAIMCERCFPKYGVGLGTGRGQRFDYDTREKVAG